MSDFAILADHRVKRKENEKINEYSDLRKLLLKLWSLVTVIPIVVDELGTVPKGLEDKLEELEIRGRIENIQSATWSKLARILRKVLEKYQ